ncbi:MAG: hypothetical protein EXS48_03420 [Candidatus Staskawiczbacteria bacterium]|nr:hypothetical protein [Candidatus Staskawiczbacteria bacterium]
MTEKQLISKLQTLKQIKPRQGWVVLTKNEMFKNEVAYTKPAEASFTGLFSNAFRFAYNHKMAYSFSALLFIFAGAFGFAQYTLPGDTLFSVKKITEQSQAALIGETNVKSTFETLKKRSQDLAVVKTQKNGNVSSATKELNDVAKSLTDAITKDPSLAKEVAMGIASDQTLMAVFSVDDLKESSDLLYKAIDEQMIEEFQRASKKTTLTLEQQEKVEEILALYNDGKYAMAMEKILLMNN